MTDSLNDLEQRQAVKRNEILAVATKLFFEEGYGRTTMDNVLAGVGGSKRTLYKYFPNKEALFKAIVARVSDRVLAALTHTDDRQFKTDLIEMGVRYLKVMTSPDGIALYRAMVAEASHFPELAENFLRNGPCRASGHLAGYLRAHSSQNGLDIADPDLAAAQFMGAVRGNVHLLAVLSGQIPSEEDIRRVSTTAVEGFLNGWAR